MRQSNFIRISVKIFSMFCLVFFIAGCGNTLKNPFSPDLSSKNSSLKPMIMSSNPNNPGEVTITLNLAAQRFDYGIVTLQQGSRTIQQTFTEAPTSLTWNNVYGVWNVKVDLFDADGNLVLSSTGRVLHIKGVIQVKIVVHMLIFWNKLGSYEELANSEVGPDFDHIQGVQNFGPVEFGNGVEFFYQEAAGVAIEQPVYFGSLKAGAIEFWYSSDTTEPDREAMYFSSLLTPDYNFAIGIGLYWDSGYVGNYGLVLGEGAGSTANRIMTGTPGDGGITFVPGLPTHLAFCWDFDGIDGTADTLRIYRDGVLIVSGQSSLGTYQDNWTNFIVWGVGDFRPGWATAPHGLTDNLKFWNYAKTDYSDRFVE